LDEEWREGSTSWTIPILSSGSKLRLHRTLCEFLVPYGSFGVSEKYIEDCLLHVVGSVSHADPVQFEIMELHSSFSALPPVPDLWHETFKSPSLKQSWLSSSTMSSPRTCNYG